MRIPTIISILVFLLCSLSSGLLAQEGQKGVITYEQIVTYNLEGVYEDPGWAPYIEGLPKEGKETFILSFTQTQALYEKVPSKKGSTSSRLQEALFKASFTKPPSPKLKGVYYDFEKQEKLQEIEFMTRDFIVEESSSASAWKFLPQRKKVQDYVCMGASRQEGEGTITAWFTPELPISAGPALYNGLPGLILAIEKEGEVVILATKINLDPQPNELVIQKPGKGQKLSQEKFDKIVEEKQAEYNNTRKAKAKAKAGAKGKAKGKIK